MKAKLMDWKRAERQVVSGKIKKGKLYENVICDDFGSADDEAQRVGRREAKKRTSTGSLTNDAITLGVFLCFIALEEEGEEKVRYNNKKKKSTYFTSKREGQAFLNDPEAKSSRPLFFFLYGPRLGFFFFFKMSNFTFTARHRNSRPKCVSFS